MGKIPFVPEFPLRSMSVSFKRAATKPRHLGTVSQSSEMRVATGDINNPITGERIVVSLLVDETDGVIADAKFTVFGETALVGIAECTVSSLIRKTYEQARRIGSEYIEKLLESKNTKLPAVYYGYVNLVIDAVIQACVSCLDIPVKEVIEDTPFESFVLEEEAMPDWETASDDTRIRYIKAVIDKEVRPYIELDAGGIQVLELKNGIELVIAYEGACATCPSSIGGTLNAITRILRAKVYPHLIVTPDASFLQLQPNGAVPQ